MIIFEFFSGVGGMHQAMTQIPGIDIKKIFPFDINPNANITYLHNFGIKPFEISIESFSLDDYETLCANEGVQKSLIWTMSPPCQPFTRQGNEKDVNDERSKAFLHLMKILSETKYTPKFFLLENVKNFESSDACALLKKILINRGYKITQFLISPNQVGVPNSRHRYYLLARDQEEKDFIEQTDEIISSPEIFYKLKLIEESFIDPHKLEDFLQILELENNKTELYISEKLLSKEATNAIDIVTREFNSTCCFTKGYGKLLKGSGSLLLIDPKLYKKNFNLLDLLNKLRYFSPEEIKQLMSFNSEFTFPDKISVKSRYKLLGNSVNVKVINLLLQYLLFY